MDLNLVYWIVSIALVAGGLAGLVLPALPGAPLLFLGLLIAAWTEGFAYVGPRTLILIAVLGIITYGVDLGAAMFGAKRFGASKRAMIGAVAGFVLGMFLGFPAVLFGPFIGAVIGELTARRGLHQAARAGFGATIGLVLGAALKLALAFAMIGIFIVARFF